MDHANLIAIDIHTHAEVSCWNPFDNYGEEYDRAADKYFKNGRRPTIAETVAGYNGTLWIGLFAPAGVPADTLAKLQEGMARALAAKDLRDRLELQGVEIAPKTTPEQFAALLQEDIAKWARVVKSSGATVD